MTDDDTSNGRLIDCRAPTHARGSRRLLLVPGTMIIGDGSGGHAVVLLRLGRVDGSLDTLFRGTSLYGASEVATGAVGDRRPDAIWITDRSYLRRHWSPWLVRTVESRLADAADRVGAPLVSWTGEGRDPAAGTDDTDGVDGADDADGAMGVERTDGIEHPDGTGRTDGYLES